MKKHIVKFGTTTNVSGETMSEPSFSSTTGAPSWSASKTQFSKMNVLLDVTITGTSPTVTFAINEYFGGIWVQTAKSKAISATGKYLLVQGAVPPDQTSVLNQGAFWGLGSGIDKQVVTTVTGTQVVLSADVYFIFFD